jgi:hypothetical protein
MESQQHNDSMHALLGDTGTSEDGSIPGTPIQVLQRVGLHLGIGNVLLSKEKLEVDPSVRPPNVADDK